MTTCPTCSRPVDTLRARSVGVRDGKVVAYCSAECAAKAEALTATPARGVPARVRGPAPLIDSGPVIEILHEPASGVVTSARDERVATGPVSEIRTAETPPPTKPAVEPSPATPGAAAVVSASADRADASATKRPGKNTMRRRRDSVNAKAGWDWLDDEPADVRSRTATEGEAQGKGRGVVVTLLVLALLGGGGYVAYRYLYVGHAASSLEPKGSAGGLVPGSVEPVATAPDAAVVTKDPAVAKAALDRAREVLHGYLASKSQRVQRVAAEALARTGDPDALAVLATALEQSKLEASGKLNIAYALARGGDKRGSDALAAALTSPNRDDKLTAGRLLAQLGDRRAIAIATYLDVSQNRLSVAIELARLAEPASVAALEAIRADPKTTPEARSRATIALGLAGKTEVASDLHGLLADSHFNVFAAEALAVLHDEAARPVLAKLLDVSTLRVGAARGLRRLAPDLDPAPYLPSLLASLGKAEDPETKDTVQIEVAETILLLTGPAAWSERI